MTLADTTSSMTGVSKYIYEQIKLANYHNGEEMCEKKQTIAFRATHQSFHLIYTNNISIRLGSRR